ncbi:DUF1465 family protein [Sphingomonadaceae bacterium jetA1]|jgi:regulator of CtrA degradation|uniref:DUF1465 family protein n=1 Tax=Facivitalis istanbulensis TaxID=3075838 RepID=UPI00348C652C
MTDDASERYFQTRIVDGLYREAMSLAEAARAYFDQGGRRDREDLDPPTRVAFSCESLKVTTRLMHVIAWILTQRAVEAGELAWQEACDPVRRLGLSPDSEDAAIRLLPDRAQRLVHASLDLHRRVARIDAMADAVVPDMGPVQALQARLNGVF